MDADVSGRVDLTAAAVEGYSRWARETAAALFAAGRPHAESWPETDGLCLGEEILVRVGAELRVVLPLWVPFGRGISSQGPTVAHLLGPTIAAGQWQWSQRCI